MKKFFIGVILVFFIVGCGKKEPVAKINYIEEGLKYLAQQDLGNALKSFDLAIQKNPKNVETYLMVAEIYFKLKNYAGAEALGLKALQLDPENGDVYYLLAMARGAQGNEKEAFELLKSSLQAFSQRQQQEKAEMVVGLLQRMVGAPGASQADVK